MTKAHPGVQARYIRAELNMSAKDLMIALTILQGRKLVEAKADHKYDKWRNADDMAMRFYPKI